MNNALTIVERVASALTSMTHEDAIRALIAKSAGAEEKRLIELAEPEERRLAALRDAWDEKIKAEKEAKEAAARARIASLQSAIELIRGAAISMTRSEERRVGKECSG